MPWRVREHKGALVVAVSSCINDTFLEDLQHFFTRVEGGHPFPIVFTGASKRTFCSGIDLGILTGNEDRFREFMHRLATLFYQFFTLPHPTAAAINGHCVGSGCILALLCDFRLSTDGPFRIGLNQVRLGLSPHRATLEMLACYFPIPCLNTLVLQGSLYSPQEALQHGLLNMIVPPKQLLDTAVTFFDHLPRAAYAVTKRRMQQSTLERIPPRDDRSDREDDDATVASFLVLSRIHKHAVDRLSPTGSEHQIKKFAK